MISSAWKANEAMGKDTPFNIKEPVIPTEPVIWWLSVSWSPKVFEPEEYITLDETNSVLLYEGNINNL